MDEELFGVDSLESIMRMTPEEYDSHCLEVVNEIARRVDSGETELYSEEELDTMLNDLEVELCSE